MTLIETHQASAHDLPLDDESVYTIITSPPYYGLRKYDGEQALEWPAVEYAPMPGLPVIHIEPMNAALGLEPTPEAYIGHMVLVARELWRVLRDDGTLWLNIGDSYWRNPKRGNQENGNHAGLHSGTGAAEAMQHMGSSIDEKNLLLIPQRLALALQADGWYVRSDIIWAKGISFCDSYAGSCMPESVRDRPTKGHEYLWLLTKNKRYFYDQDAVREAAVNPNGGGFGPNNPNGTMRNDVGRERGDYSNGRNLRSVWTISPRGYGKAHYAVFPPALVEPCVKAGTSEYGVCPDCGAPWERVVELGKITSTGGGEGREGSGMCLLPGKGDANVGRMKAREHKTTGWIPTCSCYGIEPPNPLHEPTQPRNAEPPFTCDECDGSGHADTVPMFADMVTPCPACDGVGTTEPNQAWLDWQAECEAVQHNRRAFFRKINALDLPVAPATVLDPFAGSGTTANVASKLGRRAVLCDVSAEYLREHVPERTTVQMELIS